MNALTAYSAQWFSTTGAGDPLSAASFAPYISAATGLAPNTLTASDMDGDGKADLVLTSGFSSGFLSIFRNTGTTGTISFAARTDFTNNTWTYDVKQTVADLDGDGKPDVIISNPNAEKLFIFRNTSAPGNISLAAPVEVTATSPRKIAIADFNGDGKPDISVMGYDFQVLRNTSTAGSLSFTPAFNLQEGNYYQDMVTADFNGDRKPDIALLDFNKNLLIFYRNISTGSSIGFDYKAGFTTSSSPQSLAAGDIDKDGILDLAVVCPGGNTISLFRNTSAGGGYFFMDPRIDLPVANAANAAFGNIDGDAKPDLLVSTRASTLVVLQNTTSGSIPSFAAQPGYAINGNGSAVVACDLDSDGKTDISVTHANTSNITILRNRQKEPLITSFTPRGGLADTTVLIQGSNFTGAATVTIGNVPAASFSVLSDTSITAVAGNGTSGAVTVTTTYGTGSLDGFVFGPPPVVTAFNPASAKPGATVVIKGTGFRGATGVSFGGVPARTFYEFSDSLIQAVVDTGASGNVAVTTAKGTGALSGFIFLSPPVITSITPDSSFSGATIQLKGSYFAGTTSVTFGEVPAASFTVTSDTILTAVVGNGNSGLVAVTSPNGTGHLSGYTYLGPNIYGFSPQTGGPGAVVTISGIRFTGVNAVSFGGIPATSFTLVSDNTITAVVGNGATGDVSVTTPIGTCEKGGFIAPPFIASILPASAPAGTSVTISGNSFSTVFPVSSVYFGTVRAVTTAISATSITASVPFGSFFTPVSVTNNNLTGYSPRPFVTSFTGGPLVPASYASKQLLRNGVGSIIALGDVNRDGKPDVLIPRPGGFSVFRNSSANGAAVLDTAVSFPSATATGNTATAIALADLNMDGGLDVLLAGTVQNSLSVYGNLNLGTQVRFSSYGSYAVGTGAYELSVGDLDKDGRPDIVVSNYASSTLSILRNTSASNALSFAAKTDLTTLSAPRLTFIEDMDGDGKPDIVVQNTSSNSFSIFRNTTSAGSALSFARRDISVGPNSTLSNIAVADIDGDGKPDVAVNTIGLCSVFRNTSTAGAFSFANTADYFNYTSGSSGITINDVDGDSKPDIILNFPTPGTAQLFKNNSIPGTLSIAAGVGYPILTSTNFTYTADLNLDGRPDLISSNTEGLYYLRNKFNEPPVINSFSPQTALIGDTVIITGNNLTGATAVTFGGTAFNSFTVLSDKSIAAVVSASGSGAVSVTTPYGTSSIGNLVINTPPVIAGFSPVSAAVGAAVTITGSGFSPVAANNTVLFGTIKATVTNASATSLMVLVPPGVSQQHLSVTAGGLTATSSRFFNTTFPGAGPAFVGSYFDTSSSFSFSGISGIRSVNTGDVDGDGKPDLLMNTYSGTFKTTLLRNTGNGTNLSFGPQVVLPAGGGNSLILADIGGDGQPDLLTGNYNGASVAAIYKNNSTPGNLSLTTDLILNNPTGTDSRIRTADMDGDGRPDIISKAQYDGRVFLFRNTSANGVSSYSAPLIVAQVTDGAGADYDADILVEDFSGDGRPDIAVLLTSGILMLKNTGAGGSIAFTSQRFSYGAYSSKNGVAADFDGDGRIDIGVAFSNSNGMTISRNVSTDGNISFAKPIITPLAYAPWRIATGDLDGDGKPDLCITNSGANGNSFIYKNTSPADTITFAAPVNFTANGPGPVTISDVNGDGKPDILFANEQNNRLQLFRNAIGEPVPLVLCPPVASTSISSNVTGASYQWQVNAGSGFTDITDNANYTGTNTATLQLKDIPSSWYGYQYRCVAGSVSSNVFTVQFATRWNGTVSTAWENAANWNCGVVPDVNTDVIINAGQVTINSPITIRSLKVQPGATVTVKGSNILTVLH